MLDVVVLLNGFPGVGKSTVAPGIASRVGLPRLSKDTIKEALWDALPKPAHLDDLAWSRRLGPASFEAMWRAARDLGPRLLMDAPFEASWTRKRVAQVADRAIEVFVFADPEVVFERHRSRLPTQHACHLPYRLTSLDEVRGGMKAFRPLRLGGPLLEVDLSHERDIHAVAEWITANL